MKKPEDKKEEAKDKKVEDVLFCPKCESEEVKKNGFFKVNEIKVQKFLCKECGNHFSAKTDTVEVGEHRPELNNSIIELALTGMSAKAIAEELGCSKRTVQVKIKKYMK